MQVPKFIVKRDGSKEAFDLHKIVNALHKAGRATGEFGEYQARKLAVEVVSRGQFLAAGKDPGVEDIQDIVEDVLIASPYRRTAKAYLLYREQHARIREIGSKFNSDLLEQYLFRKDWQVSENSNMGYSLQGLNNYLSSEISKTYWLNNIYPASVRQAHSRGEMHIHDLNSLSAYCVGWDLEDLLREGFCGASGKIESRPAKHFRTALGQIVNFFYTLQGESAGAQAFSNFDTLLAPFIYYDNLDYHQTRQALQEFMFNINVPTRVGFQTPFTNITLDLTVPSHYAGRPVIVGGELRDRTYGQFTEQMRMLNRALLEVMVAGDAKGRVFTFPIPTYNIGRDFDWDTAELDLLWEATAKYGIPYFSNFVNSEMKPEDARSMCCRLRIDNRELRSKGGGLFGASPLTGSIGVVTVNMPRLGYCAATEDEFFRKLGRVMGLARDALEIKRKVLERFTSRDLYPYMKFYLRNVEKRFGCYWKNHFSTIGLVGMNEACVNLLAEDIGSDRGREFALHTLDFMRERLLQYQQETGNNYNLEATPAEGTSYRLAKKDKKDYPGIVCANEGAWKEGAEPFYTNSTQLPVNYSDDLFEILDLQDGLQTKYTGGTVLHMYTGESVGDAHALRAFVRNICEGYKLPYFSVTPTFSVCPSCGYLRGNQEVCPHCKRECEVFSRVAGYLRPVKQWNPGKRQEFSMRTMVRFPDGLERFAPPVSA